MRPSTWTQGLRGSAVAYVPFFTHLAQAIIDLHQAVQVAGPGAERKRRVCQRGGQV